MLEALQRRRGLDAELVGEQPAELAVDLQRVRLAARAVQRQHQPGAQPLPQRVGSGQLLQLADQLAVPAEGQVGVDPVLQGGQPLLLQPDDVPARERLGGEVGEGRSAPQLQRLAQQPGRQGVLAGGQAPAPLGGQPLEAVEVQLARVDPEQVAGRPRQQQVGAPAAAGAQRLAQPRHVHPQRALRVARRAGPPEVLDQPVGRHHAARVQQQVGQERPLPDPAERQRPVVPHDLERSEDAKFHPCSSPSAGPALTTLPGVRGALNPFTIFAGCKEGARSR